VTDAKPYRHRFPRAIIQHTVWLSYGFPLSDQDVRELLHQRGNQVSHETLRDWCLNFVPSVPKTRATGNPAEVPGGNSMRCVRLWMAFDTDSGGIPY